MFLINSLLTIVWEGHTGGKKTHMLGENVEGEYLGKRSKNKKMDRMSKRNFIFMTSTRNDTNGTTASFFHCNHLLSLLRSHGMLLFERLFPPTTVVADLEHTQHKKKITKIRKNFISKRKSSVQSPHFLMSSLAPSFLVFEQMFRSVGC